MAEYKIIGNFGSSFANSDNITLSASSGTITPSSVTKLQLEQGVTVTADENVTIVATVANGKCYSVSDSLTPAPSNAPLPTDDPYYDPENPSTFNGWKFVAGTTNIFNIPQIGFHRGTLFNCPSTYGFGQGVSPTTTQVNLPGTDCYVQEFVTIEKGYGIVGSGSVSNLALTGFLSYDNSAITGLTPSVPCYNFDLTNSNGASSIIIADISFELVSAAPANSILLYWYDYYENRESYYYQDGKIYVVTTQAAVGSTATSVDDNSTGAANCASGTDWYDTSQSSGSGGDLFYGANFPFTDSADNQVSGAFVKINSGVPYPTEFAICYQGENSYSYVACDGSTVNGTLSSEETITVCAQSITSTGSGIEVTNTGECSDNTGQNSSVGVSISLINSSGTGNPGTGTLSGSIAGNNGTSGTWSASYSPEISYVDNDGDGNTITPESIGDVVLSGITLINGVTYTLSVE